MRDGFILTRMEAGNQPRTSNPALILGRAGQLAQGGTRSGANNKAVTQLPAARCRGCAQWWIQGEVLGEQAELCARPVV